MSLTRGTVYFESILNELTATNDTSYAGCCEDEWCSRAEAVIRKLIKNKDALIIIVSGATQANIVTIAAALSPIQSVIAADTGHRFITHTKRRDSLNKKLMSF